jgi:hypothetical protein
MPDSDQVQMSVLDRSEANRTLQVRAMCYQSARQMATSLESHVSSDRATGVRTSSWPLISRASSRQSPQKGAFFLVAPL